MLRKRISAQERFKIMEKRLLVMTRIGSTLIGSLENVTASRAGYQTFTTQIQVAPSDVTTSAGCGARERVPGARIATR